MVNFKNLQKLFFLLVMGFSLSLICACGNDEEDEPVQNPNEETTNPTDSIPSEDEPAVPNDSIADDNTNPMDSIPSIDEPVIPNDSIVNSGTVVINGHEAIDLGLSVQWATCNMGASLPEEYGDYFAWGETVSKSSYDSDNSVTYGLSTSELDSCAIIGSDGNLTAAYDAATVNWGSAWRMPTLDEIKELIDKCTWEWITYKNVRGCLVTGPNGNSIFLPAAGRCFGTNLFDVDSYGHYWSATPYGSSYGAYSLYFDSGDYNWNGNYWRTNGHAVRPVSDELLSDSEK